MYFLINPFFLKEYLQYLPRLLLNPFFKVNKKEIFNGIIKIRGIAKIFILIDTTYYIILKFIKQFYIV